MIHGIYTSNKEYSGISNKKHSEKRPPLYKGQTYLSQFLLYQYILPSNKGNLSIKDKTSCSDVSFIQRFHCIATFVFYLGENSKNNSTTQKVSKSLESISQFPNRLLLMQSIWAKRGKLPHRLQICLVVLPLLFIAVAFRRYSLFQWLHCNNQGA